ncbi:hypothetical protein HORIV_25940 [Vreelandella olivaria]|uniref:Uncharacterized protein n=1 Tax=Vreelandella olivaria TaxID=390919 RepID=A0ABM7GID1_9GAMM|nr:hypothetical protein HORIV_25940 [Halomonas olivaria]
MAGQRRPNAKAHSALGEPLTRCHQPSTRTLCKTPQQAWPWTLTADMDTQRIESRLADIASARLQQLNGSLAGTLNLGSRAERLPTGPPSLG